MGPNQAAYGKIADMSKKDKLEAILMCHNMIGLSRLYGDDRQTRDEVKALKRRIKALKKATAHGKARVAS